MVSLRIDLEKVQYIEFKRACGGRGMAAALRGMIRAYSGTQEENIDELLLRKTHAVRKEAKEKADLEFAEVDAKLKELEARRKQEEIVQLQKQQEQKAAYDEMRYKAAKANAWRIKPK